MISGREYRQRRGVDPSISTPIDVQIWSDVQCPWCYIGKRRFEAAVEQFDGEVTVTYRSFELAPDTPVDFEGSPVDYLSQREGVTAEQAQQMVDRVCGIAESVGLVYHYDRIHQTNTVPAHALLHFAKAHGKQVELKERLLRAYFTEGRHIGRALDLAELAAEVGLDPAAEACEGDACLIPARGQRGASGSLRSATTAARAASSSSASTNSEQPCSPAPIDTRRPTMPASAYTGHAVVDPSGVMVPRS